MTTIQQNLLNPNTQPLIIGDFTIRQDEDGRYSLTDLHKASGSLKKHQPTNFLRIEQTQELIKEIEQCSDMRIGGTDHSSNMRSAVKVINGGHNRGTYAVKEMVYAYAMWISAKFHLMVIRAYDSLVMQWKINGKQTISPEQAEILYHIIHTRAEGNKSTIIQMWSRLKNHFKYPSSYHNLKAIHFEDAVNYLETMKIKVKDSIHIDENQAIEILCGQAKLFQAWWNTHSPTLAKLNPLLVSMLHDNMFYMTYAISDICKKYSVELPVYDYQHMFELKTSPHQRYNLLK